MILNLARCFSSPRYHIFRNRSFLLMTLNTCSTFARTEDVAYSAFLAVYRPLRLSFLSRIGNRRYCIWFCGQIYSERLRPYACQFWGSRCHRKRLLPLQSAILIYADMRFIAKVPRVTLLDLMCIRIPLLLLWCVSKLCSISAATTWVISFSCNPFFTSRFRKSPMISPFDTWLLESMSQKSKNSGSQWLPPLSIRRSGHTDFAANTATAWSTADSVCCRVLLYNSTVESA